MGPLAFLPILGTAIKYAPGLIKLLAGDQAGDVAETVVNVAKQVLGTDDPDEAKAKLASDPALAQRFTAELNAGTERYRMQIEDTQNARATMTTLAGSGSAIAWAPVIVSVLITVGFFGVLFLLLYSNVKFSELSGQVLLILVGTLGAQFTQVGNYWLGSSAGSANKDASLRAMLDPVLPRSLPQPVPTKASKK